MKRILMIAFHYPPFHGGSGVHRALKFSRYLPDYGWQPVMLSAHPRAYTEVTSDKLRPMGDLSVMRAFALDTARHLSVRGSYLRCTALPDRWVSWWLGAVPMGLRMIRRHRPDLIWSTYPIATAHLIGLTLHRLTGIPWVADFRDSMTEEGYPSDRSIRHAYRWIEQRTVHHSTCAIFTAPGTLRMYADRYPEIPDSRWHVVSNGYDEEDFTAISPTMAPLNPEQLTLVHSGLIYPSERDPSAFFSALATLRRTGKISSSSLKIILRASGNEHAYRGQLREKRIDDIVHLEPSVPHYDALAEMMRANGLLVFQASNCNHQIPAKIYEYLRTGVPILALTDAKGDTANLLRAFGNNMILELKSEAQIVQGLLTFLSQIRQGCMSYSPRPNIEQYSRKFHSQLLAKLLDVVVDRSSALSAVS